MNVTGTTKLFATFGNPNYGNPAPAIYNAAMADSGVDGVYVALEPKDIGEDMEAVRSLNFGGGTITQPFKQQVIGYIDEVDDDARQIGAVNVVINQGGKIRGRNSDWIGAINALKSKIDPTGRKVALLGAGGAARAVAFALLSTKADVTIFNRTAAKAQELCDQFECTYGGDLRQITSDFDIVINATSVGAGSEGGSLPIDSSVLENKPVVFDITVRPRHTAFLKQASQMGCETISGIEMVAYLAVPTLEWLTGVRPNFEIIQHQFSKIV